MDALSAQNVSKSYSSVGGGGVSRQVLSGVSLTVRPGEMVSIVGESGSGKSTLMYCLSGLETVDGGSVSIFGQDVSELSRSKLPEFRRDHCGFIFQGYNLVESLTARENVVLPARLARKPVDDRVAVEVMESLGIAQCMGQKPGQLSGGQQQRVAIARVLVNNPAVVFADEPTGALDSAASEGVLDNLRKVTDQGGTVVLVTHDLAAAARADRVVVLRDGTIGQQLVCPSAAEILQAMQGTGAPV